ncbi:MAG: hypothetical protein HGA90_01250 [Alphaproteobacteria bacterium]|nr:hypothetical protein [Alphaproteobacteria bacterium]
MKGKHRLGVFRAAAKLGFKQVLQERLILCGQYLIFSTIVIAYAGIFRWVPESVLAPRGLTNAMLIWYMAGTEFGLFCSSFYFKELQGEIYADQIHLALLRPCPLWVVKLGEWSGQYLARMIALVFPAVAVAGFMSGDFSLAPHFLLGLALSLPAAGVISIAAHFIIGSSCLWLKQAEPIYWIWQKCMFLFGALLWPLALYPDLLRTLVWFTPFPAILAVPAGWVLPHEASTVALSVIYQLLWASLFVGLAAAINRALLRHIQRGGGAA